MQRNTQCLTLVSILALTAGTTFAAPTTDSDRPNNKANQPKTVEMEKVRNADLLYYSSIEGMELLDSQGETLGTVEDLLFESGTGDILGIVLSRGGLMGIGADTILVSATEVSFTRDALKTNSLTAAELKDRPEFDPSIWKAGYNPSVDEVTWWDTAMDTLGFGEDDRTSEHADMGGKSPKTVTGTIAHRLTRTQDGESMTSLVLDIDEGTSEADRNGIVVLAPTWFLAEHGISPTIGESVTLQVQPMRDQDGRAYYRATSYMTNHSDNADNTRKRNPDSRDAKQARGVTLYNSNAPAWLDIDSRTAMQARAKRIVLMSSLVGNGISTEGDDSGEVQDFLINIDDKRAIAASIDPNENFLGLADTLHLIPLGSTRVLSEGDLRLDISRETLLNAPEAPSDVAKLSPKDRERATETNYISWEQAHMRLSDRDAKERDRTPQTDKKRDRDNTDGTDRRKK